MKNLIAALMLFSSTAAMADCFDMAGRDYRIDPDLLRAISWNESRFNPAAIGPNPTTGYGVGLMQIDSQHFNSLSSIGVSERHLKQDPCMNIYTGAYYLAIAFKKWGATWQAVGAYNAGFKDSPKQAQRRYKYASKIEKTYRAIKANKQHPLLVQNP